MIIVLFAIIGATINANVWYWFCFGVYCAWKVTRAIVEVMK